MTEAALKKDRNEGQHSQHSGREGELCQVGADVGRFAEVGKVKHRPGLPALDENKKGEENYRAHAFAKDPWIGPAAVVASDKRERRQEKPATVLWRARGLLNRMLFVPSISAFIVVKLLSFEYSLLASSPIQIQMARHISSSSMLLTLEEDCCDETRV